MTDPEEGQTNVRACNCGYTFLEEAMVELPDGRIACADCLSDGSGDNPKLLSVSWSIGDVLRQMPIGKQYASSQLVDVGRTLETDLEEFLVEKGNDFLRERLRDMSSGG